MINKLFWQQIQANDTYPIFVKRMVIMKSKYLSTDSEFLTAALTQVRVSVWFVENDKQTLMDYGGKVEGYSPLFIKISGKRFPRDLFQFRVK